MTILNMVYYSKQDSWWDLSKWAISQTSSALSSTWYGWVHFNNDWTKIYLTQYGNGWRIHEWTLSTPYDISTISITNSLSIQYPEDIHFSGDGKKMFIIKSDSSPYRILRYSLSTAWSISTAAQDQYIDRGGSNADRWLYITPDGKNIYIWTRSWSSDGLVKYTLSTAWDLSTAWTVESISNTIWWISIRFGNNWKLLFTSTEWISTIRYYRLSTAYNVSSVTEQWTLNIAWATRAWWMWFNDSWTMWVIVWWGGSTNYVTKYTL